MSEVPASRHGARVALRDVVVRRGELVVLDGISLEVQPGELVVVIGASGAGKSTLLSVINRLVPLSAGAIEIDGVDASSLPAPQLRRRIGYCFQHLGLFPHLSVADNIGITPRLLGWSRPRIDRRIDELLERVGLSPIAHRDRLPSQLSGGQAQRVALARALAAAPALLLLDEPFGALDPDTRARLQLELLEIVRSLGVTVLMVSHDLAEALLLADRVAVIVDGRVVRVGTPREVIAEPASPEVAALVGPAITRARRLVELVR